MRKKLIANVLLVILPVSSIILFLEVVLSPPQTLTTIFVPDSKLGWKLRPNASDLWGEVPVKINGKGLRGPELPYEKPPGKKRILYLGDSVTFGYKIADYNHTFPHLIEGLLEENAEYEIETINSGVGGYSPWQEYIFLTTEGIKYDPDLIIISFVLNDVGEKLGLTKFGGLGKGYQLERSVSGIIDETFNNSSIWYYAKRLSAKIRFGNNIQQGAQQQEALSAWELATEPERQDIREAWEITLHNLGKIFEYARERNIPVLLVVFPFTFQFSDINSLATPQAIVRQHALENSIPVIDLLPLLYNVMEQDSSKPEDLFIDADHLTPTGSIIVAEILADFVQQHSLISTQ